MRRLVVSVAVVEVIFVAVHKFTALLFMTSLRIRRLTLSLMFSLLVLLK